MPRDSFNREIDYLRISVIDNCNLRCVYCMPLEGLRFLPREELLTPAEIEQAMIDVELGKFGGGFADQEPASRSRFPRGSSRQADRQAAKIR